MGLISIANLSISLFAIFLAHHLYWEATTGSRRRAFKKAKGCLPPKHYRHFDPIFGFDIFLDSLKHQREHNFLGWLANEFKNNDTNTMSVLNMGKVAFITNDSENVKDILASNFDGWSIGESSYVLKTRRMAVRSPPLIAIVTINSQVKSVYNSCPPFSDRESSPQRELRGSTREI
jgi:hypothetical protein